MNTAPQTLGLTDRATTSMQHTLAGHPAKRINHLAFAGPAFVASIAYMDPGNFATNIQAGAQHGYSLLWVVLSANLIAMLFQALSAKLGIVTQKNLAESCRDYFPKPIVYAMWIASEVAAMATELAELLGGAIGLSLLFRLPLLGGMIVTATVTYAILIAERRGFRPIEIIIGALVATISLCYLIELFLVSVDWPAVAVGSFTPTLPSTHALTVAVGILGATVMPHAIYLHSGLTQRRIIPSSIDARRLLIRYSNREVIVALSLAGLVNLAMVIMAAAAFHSGHAEVAEIETAYRTLAPLLGTGAAVVFLVALMASGISSSVVGTMAGQMIMQGFTGIHIPVWLRRLITMAPAFVVVAIGVNPTDALVYSQVVLSFSLPIPMISLVLFTSRRRIMGDFANNRCITTFAAFGTILVLTLNLILILQVFGIEAF